MIGQNFITFITLAIIVSYHPPSIFLLYKYVFIDVYLESLQLPLILVSVLISWSLIFLSRKTLLPTTQIMVLASYFDTLFPLEIPASFTCFFLSHFLVKRTTGFCSFFSPHSTGREGRHLVLVTEPTNTFWALYSEILWHFLLFY